MGKNRIRPPWRREGFCNERTYAAWLYLTDGDRARKFVENLADLALKRQGPRLPESRNLSLTLQHLVALDLARATADGWLNHVASLGLDQCVNFFELADRLLRRYVAEYVPSEAWLPNVPGGAGS